MFVPFYSSYTSINMSMLLQESGHVSCRIRHNEWHCWQGPTAFYPVRPCSPVTLIRRGVMNGSQVDPLFGEEEQFWNIRKAWKNKNMTETKIDCADEDQQEFSLPDTTAQLPSLEGERWMIVRPIFSSKGGAEHVKGGREQIYDLIQDWLSWRGPTGICPTRHDSPVTLSRWGVMIDSLWSSRRPHYKT